MTNKSFVSTTELAELLGVTRVTVFRKIKSGEIKAVKVGRNFVIDKNDLPGILGTTLVSDNKREIEQGVNKAVQEYGETLRLLGKE